MPDPTFNGVDLLLVAVLLLAAALATYAARRADRAREPEPSEPRALFDRPLAGDLDVARSVRETYGGLPYRNAPRRGRDW